MTVTLQLSANTLTAISGSHASVVCQYIQQPTVAVTPQSSAHTSTTISDRPTTLSGSHTSDVHQQINNHWRKSRFSCLSRRMTVFANMTTAISGSHSPAISQQGQDAVQNVQHCLHCSQQPSIAAAIQSCYPPHNISGSYHPVPLSNTHDQWQLQSNPAIHQTTSVTATIQSCYPSNNISDNYNPVLLSNTQHQAYVCCTVLFLKVHQLYDCWQRISGLAKTILNNTVKGGRRQGRQKRWSHTLTFIYHHFKQGYISQSNVFHHSQ